MMPRIAIVLGLVLITSPVAGQEAIAPQEAFTRLKALVGTWDVTERDNPNTKEVATYSITGRAVLTEDLRAAEGTPNAMGHMYTTYHLDNGKLVLTHYCGAGNQPRMRLTSTADGGKRVSFEIYDITNLATPESFHSTALDVVFLTSDRVNLVYRGTRGPAPGTSSEQVFQLTRRKTSF